ncbi:MAG: class I SAM-dependent methyltransferase [Bacteroidales bacterium]|nr:class I SAM-dependent methyltransferase [Bacteroidales bacterium]
MEGVIKRFDFEEKKTKGEAQLVKFSVGKEQSMYSALRALINGFEGEYSTEGDYVKLYVGNTLMMSDTRMEKNSNLEFVRRAFGDVFIAGLGIGLIIHNIKEKAEKGIVTSVTVIEKSQDVIDLISPYYKDMNIKYICGDVMEYKPKKDEKYDTVYFDIWPFISTDNLEDMRKLSYIWRSHKKTEDSWIGYWQRDFLRRRREQERREELRWW